MNHTLGPNEPNPPITGTRAELEALRRALFFSQKEAADILGLTELHWRQMEAGTRPVFDVAIEVLASLLEWRDRQIEALTELTDNAQIPTAVVWYDRVEDFISLPGNQPECFRPHQAALADFVLCDNITLIPFDHADYEQWRKARGEEDSQELRALWAAKKD